VLKCGKMSTCRNKEVSLSVGRCGVVTLVCLSMSSGGWIAICSCGNSQNFEGIMCFRIRSRIAVFCLSVDILDSAVIIFDVTKIMFYGSTDVQM
jgi:hypothetical protein